MRDNMYTEYDSQIDVILKNMTLREKIGQLNQKNIPNGHL